MNTFTNDLRAILPVNNIITTPKETVIPEDLCAIILSRLPIKSIISFKLVCKNWKSLVESPFFRDLYLSHNQNSRSSSWSFMCRGCETETMSHYGSGSWNLTRSLGSFISSFLTEKFENRQGRIVAYTDVGIVLIHVVTSQSFYVANPVSSQCVEILPHVPLEKRFWILGIATRTEDGVVLGYKVVLLKTDFSFLIYSSETGLWSPEASHFPFSFISQELVNPISLNGRLHWLAHNHEHQDFVVSFDFYATGTDHSSHPCRATPFPDLDKSPKFRRACTTFQGFLMYVNVVSMPNRLGSLKEKLCVWRLKSEGWQVSEISPAFIETRFSYIPLGINPFDATKGYFWKGNRRRQCFLSVDLHNGEFVLHKELERSARDMEYLLEAHFSSFVLQQWLHPFPNTLRRV